MWHFALLRCSPPDSLGLSLKSDWTPVTPADLSAAIVRIIAALQAAGSLGAGRALIVQPGRPIARLGSGPVEEPVGWMERERGREVLFNQKEMF